MRNYIQTAWRLNEEQAAAQEKAGKMTLAAACALGIIAIVLAGLGF